jgi:hypothetical protein
VNPRASRNSVLKRLAIAAFFLGTGAAASADTWHTSRIENIYPLADGQVVVIFVDDAPACTGGTENKYHYITAGTFGVTAEGLRMMMATLLTAYAMDRRISVLFNEASPGCYINRLYIRE